MARQTAETRGSVRHLATTNMHASLKDSAYIREILDNIRKERSGLQYKLREIEQRLAELEREHNYFNSMIALPIRRIPPEVFGEIFAWALYDHKGQDYRRQDTLIGLCQVCKAWREVAHSVPYFWQHVVVDPTRTSLSYEGVSSWMSRSRSLPRTLNLSAYKCGRVVSMPHGAERRLCSGGSNCIFSNRTLARILKDGPSLSHVKIRCPSPECFINLSTSLLAFKDGAATFSWNSTPSAFVDAAWNKEWKNLPPSTFSFLPRTMKAFHLTLPNIRACGPEVDIGNLQIDLPASLLQGLTSLTLSCSWTADHILKLLQHCVNLENLTLDLVFGDFERWDQGDAFMQNIADNGVVLPKLQTLNLYGVYMWAVASLPLLRLPALRDLSLTLVWPSWYPKRRGHFEPLITSTLGSAVSSFIRGGRNGPATLESLKIINGIFEGETLLNALQPLHSLKCLALDNVVFDTEIFSKTPYRQLLPRLEALDLLRLHTGSDTIVGIEEFVQDRGIKFKTSRCGISACGCKR